MLGEPDCDIAVIGAGMVGVSCALELAERGLAVTLVDPLEPRGRASFGNAGVISRSSIIPLAGPGVWRKLPRHALNRDAALRLRYRALPHYARWGLAFLRRCDAASVRKAAAALNPLCAGALAAHLKRAERLRVARLIRREGSLKLYRTERAFAAGAGERALFAEHGVRFEVLDGDAVAALEPALTRRFARGVLTPDTASVDDPGALVEAYARAFAEAGGTIRRARVEALADDGERVALRLPDGVLVARQAVIAAGARADALLKPLGYRLPLAAERGYHRHFAPTARTCGGRSSTSRPTASSRRWAGRCASAQASRWPAPTIRRTWASSPPCCRRRAAPWRSARRWASHGWARAPPRLTACR